MQDFLNIITRVSLLQSKPFLTFKCKINQKNSFNYIK